MSLPEKMDIYEQLRNSPDDLQVSFVCGSGAPRRLLQQEAISVNESRPAPEVLQREVVFEDASIGLRTTWKANFYEKHSAVDWVVFFENIGKEETPILEEVNALSMTIGSAEEKESRLRYSRGGIWAPQAFEPLVKDLKPGQSHRLSTIKTLGVAHTDSPGAGLSSSPYLPFFNFDLGDEGIVVALGWTGSWFMECDCDNSYALGIKAGMEPFHLKLKPGERIRTPLVQLLPWQGDWIDGQNRFRRLLLDRYSPKPNGKSIEPMRFLQSWGSEPQEEHNRKIEFIAENCLPVDAYWIDGGWTKGNYPWTLKHWSANVGNWQESEEIYPDGLEEVGRRVHAAELGFLLWFEPTRVHKDTAIYREHPEWLIGPGEGIFKTHYLYDLTNPEAFEWIVEHVSERIANYRVDVYWSDFCFEDPLYYWNLEEDEDRQGMKQILWVEAFYRHWDELLKRHPHLIINNCAGGARMVDLESMKRSYPGWTSDLQCLDDCKSIDSQGHTFGSLFWLPISGIGVNRAETYNFRSNLRAMLSLRCWLNRTLPEEMPVDWLKRMLDQHRQIALSFLGDFYPLTEYSLDESSWMAFQLHRSDLNEGIIVTFRRQWCDDSNRCFKLRGLKSEGTYKLEDLDTAIRTQSTGKDLMTEGIEVSIDTLPGSSLIKYSMASQ